MELEVKNFLMDSFVVRYAVCAMQKSVLPALYSFDINVQDLTEILCLSTVIPIDADNNTHISNISCDKSLKETEFITDSALKSSNMAYVGKIENEKRYKKPKATKKYDMSDAEETVRLERLKEIIKQEQHLADVKLQYEQKIAKIKGDHLEEMNRLELNHVREIHNIQLKINKTQLKIVEYENIRK